MNDLKFLTAKQLIQEGNYDAARALLKTVTHPTATKWLRRIDELDPPFPENTPPRKSEREKYYKRENRRAKRRAKAFGLEFILRGAGVLVIWAVLSGFFWGHPLSDGFSGVNVIPFLLGCGIMLWGLLEMIFRQD